MKHITRTICRTARFAACAALLAALGAPAMFGQDASGNNLLTGSFRYRYVAIVNESTLGVVNQVSASEGVITFNGNGTYTISSGSLWNDNGVNGQQAIPANSTGSYTINAAGIGTFSNPDPDTNLPGTALWGTYSQGVITASTTEEGEDEFGDVIPAVSDFFVAIAVGAVPTNSTFTSPYWIGALDFAVGSDADVKNALFEITPNGSGSLGSLSIQGWANNVNGTYLTQNTTGSYNFASDGNAQFAITAPTGVATPQVLVSGARTVYVSNDGNFLLGWTTDGYDIMFGVKAIPSSVAFANNFYQGLYYMGGFGDQPTYQGTENCGPYSFWGSQNADGAGDETVHQRLYWPSCPNYTDQNGYPLPYDYGTWDVTPSIATNGTGTDSPLGYLLNSGSNLVFGDTGGNCNPSVKNATCAFVGISDTPGFMGLTIGVHAPNLSGSGLYLSPTAVVNAASYAPVTSSVAPGEFLTLFGSFGTNVPAGGLTASVPFPNFLGPIQVFINGTQAPIYFVNQNQINVVAPFELANATGYTASIQVSNNGILSNTVSVYLLTDANPGIFSYGPNGDDISDGIGYAIAEHGSGALATPTNPAQPQEEIVVDLGGMGSTSPAVTDGTVPTALSYTDDFDEDATTVYFQDYDNGVFYQPAIPNTSSTMCPDPGCPDFAGLAPGYPGVYQMNLTVPTTVGPGNDIFMEVITPYADSLQVSIPVGGTANAATAARRAVSLFGQPRPALPPLARPKPKVVRVHPKAPRLGPPKPPVQN